MSLYNNGNTVTWGKNNKEWYVIGEYNDYYILILKESEGEDYYDLPGIGDNTYPAEWPDLSITVRLWSWGDENFSDSDKARMLSETCVKAQGGVQVGFSFKIYATLLTASQVDTYLPKYSSVRGSGWWIKKPSVEEGVNRDITVAPDGFWSSSLDTDRGFRPAIGVKKRALADKYPNITSTVSASADSSNNSYHFSDSSYSSARMYTPAYNTHQGDSSLKVKKILATIIIGVLSCLFAVIVNFEALSSLLGILLCFLGTCIPVAAGGLIGLIRKEDGGKECAIIGCVFSVIMAFLIFFTQLLLLPDNNTFAAIMLLILMLIPVGFLSFRMILWNDD